jgi:hypothetical protein
MSDSTPSTVRAMMVVFAPIFGALFLTGCSNGIKSPPVQPGHPLAADVFVPLTAPIDVPCPPKTVDGKAVPQQWKDLSPKEVRQMLPIWHSSSAIHLKGAGAGLEYFGKGVTGAAGVYEWTWEEGWFRYVEGDKDSAAESTSTRKEGVSWRVTATLYTSKASLNLAGPTDLAAAFNAGWLTGSMEVQTTGVKLSSQAPGARDINEQNIKQVREEMQVINRNVAEDKLILTPFILAVRRETSASSMATAIQTMDSGNATFSSTQDVNSFSGAKKVHNAHDKDTDLYHIHVFFDKAFTHTPSVSVSISGLSLQYGQERFEVHAVNVSPDSFDIELQNWDPKKLPEVVAVSWTAVGMGRQ